MVKEKMNKDKKIEIRMTESDLKRVSALTTHYNISTSQLVRVLIISDHENFVYENEKLRQRLISTKNILTESEFLEYVEDEIKYFVRVDDKSKLQICKEFLIDSRILK